MFVALVSRSLSRNGIEHLWSRQPQHILFGQFVKKVILSVRFYILITFLVIHVLSLGLVPSIITTSPHLSIIIDHPRFLLSCSLCCQPSPLVWKWTSLHGYPQFTRLSLSQFLLSLLLVSYDKHWLPHPVIRQRRSQACQCLHTLYCLSMEIDLYILMSIAPQWTSRRRTSERNSRTCFRNQSDLIEGTHYRGLHKKCRQANYSQTHVVSGKHYSHVRFRKHNQCGFVLSIRTHTGYAS